MVSTPALQLGTLFVLDREGRMLGTREAVPGVGRFGHPLVDGR